MNYKSVFRIHDCYGCGVCSAACSKNIISIGLNRNGFYEPCIVDKDKCSNCGICLDVCAFSHSELSNKNSKPIKSWAAWSNDGNVRNKCSSGGIGFEIGKQLIEKGYHAVGCRYDVKKQRAEHYIATTVEEFIQSIGSKYIQSYTEDAFKNIKRKTQKYLITGTPCQIDSFRRLINKFHCEENFVLMDFYCHCVPSMLAWNAYLKMIESNIGNVTSVSWRNKYADKGVCDWHDSYKLVIKGCDGFEIISNWKQGDLFYKLFLGDIVLGSQCEYSCKYKYDHSSADIRIGDLWGKTYQSEEKGVSALVAFTEKGLQIIEDLKNVTLLEHPFDIVAEGQMKENAKSQFMNPVIMSILKSGGQLNGIPFKMAYNVQRGINVLKIKLKGKKK